MNILDYLSWRNDVPLSVSPFNDVDSMILSEIAYIELDGMVSDKGNFISVADVEKMFFEKYDYDYILENETFTKRAPLLLKDMAKGERFKNMTMAYYINEVEKGIDKQFSAVTFQLDDGTVFVAFRGTDNSVTGWKEDFNMLWSSETAGAKSSVLYLNKIGEAFDKPLRVGGHSKGGNFAIYASIYCDKEIQDRIINVYNNDGPGFKDEIINSKEYKNIYDRIISIIPDSSVIGLLLYSNVKNKVVKSSASGIYQHDGLTWLTNKDGFVEAELSQMSLFIEKSMGGWLEKTDEETRKSLTDSIFMAIEATGNETFREISNQKWKSAEAVISTLTKLPKEKQKELMDAIKLLIQSGGDAVGEFLPKFGNNKNV